MKSFIKQLFRVYYKEGRSYTIPFGKLKGSRLVYRDDVNFKEMLGLWENDSLNILSGILDKYFKGRKSICIADVGANLGYYSIFFSRRLDQSSSIFAFEPSASVLSLLERNIEVNDLANVSIKKAAVSDKHGEVEFFLGENHHQSSIYASWADNQEGIKKVTVPSISLDEFFGSDGRVFPDFIKMDIEGAAVFALKGCRECVTKKRPIWLIESHTADEDHAISEMVTTFDYEAYRISTGKWVTKKNEDYRNPDGIWGSMILIPSELKSKTDF
jgi:FkbM family methyltransferase